MAKSKTFKMLECIKPVDGFTVGKKYKLISNAGSYVEMEDDNGSREILSNSYFSDVSKKK